jgi:hypothetical protein
MEAVKEPLMLLEIEKELAGPGRDEAFSRYDTMLAALGERIDAEMRSGLPPEEFQKADALKEADAIARKILRLTVRVAG